MKSNAADDCVVNYIHYQPVILYMYVTLLILYVCKQQTQTKQQIYTSKQTNIQNIMVVVGKIEIIYGIIIFGQNIIKDLCNFLGWDTERWFLSIYILWVSLVILICYLPYLFSVLSIVPNFVCVNLMRFTYTFNFPEKCTFRFLKKMAPKLFH